MEREEKVVQVNTPAPALTSEQLMKMLVDSQKEAAQSNRLLAEALLESRKPYVDPAVLEQKRLAGEEKRKAVAITILQRTETKKQCLHRRTNNDGTFGEKMNIKWQEHSGGIILGVCGTCFSQFDSRTPEDLKILRMDGVAIKNMGRARENSRAV
jgi:hypothetical protein